MKKRLNIGILGTGFMGRAHSNAYRQVKPFFDPEYEPVLKVVCDNNKQKLEDFAPKWGWEDTETDWRKLVERDDIDVVDVCTPNNTHYDIVMAATGNNKIVLCEKPLAMNAKEAEEMTKAVEKTGKPNMVWFNYRRVPAVTLAKQIVEKGMIGRVFHYRVKFLQDWTISADVPQGGDSLWRLEAKTAGSGVTGDLLAHSIDTAMWMIGPIASVSAMTEIFIKQRKRQDDPGKIEPITIEDACAFLARFDNGAIGTFESTRYACGRKNQSTFEINGDKGSVCFDMENAHQLGYFNHGDDAAVRGWRTINVWDSVHPYMKKWWVPGCSIGFEHTHTHALADFLEGLANGRKMCPDFRDGLATQYVCDAVLDSAKQRRWKDIKSTTLG